MNKYKYTFHFIGVPHTVSSKSYVACAYTQKVVKLAKIFTERGHTVYHYGHEESELVCTEHVTVLSSADWAVAYGDFDWRTHFFKYDLNDHAYQTFYKNAITEIEKRKQPNDFILPFWGAGVRTICDAHQDLICVEPGIGYAGGHWAPYKIFESYAMYHAYYGLEAVGTCKQQWYDAVIPNYFDPDDFTYNDKKEDYFLYLGRVYDGKGIHIAIQVTKEIGAKLIVAGQNPLSASGYDVVPDHVVEIGYADSETRRELMANAKGAFIASLYLEPFGGVQVECMFSGTPTITTDWGAFPENNLHGITGYRCRTFDQFVWAAQNIGNISPKACREWAVHNYSLNRVAAMYDEYFESVHNAHTGKGWYYNDNSRTALPGLQKIYPTHDIKITDTKPQSTIFEFSTKMAAWVVNTFKPKRVLDIGCGNGELVYAIASHGIDVVGIDIKPEISGKFLLETHDVLHLNSKYQRDLVVCLEVAEYVDPQESCNIARQVADAVLPDGILVWAAGVVGQDGVGRINCRPKSFWKNEFKKVGLEYNSFMTIDCVKYFTRYYTNDWVVDNVMVFNKLDEVNDIKDSLDL